MHSMMVSCHNVRVFPELTHLPEKTLPIGYGPDHQPTVIFGAAHNYSVVVRVRFPINAGDKQMINVVRLQWDTETR